MRKLRPHKGEQLPGVTELTKVGDQTHTQAQWAARQGKIQELMGMYGLIRLTLSF